MLDAITRDLRIELAWYASEALSSGPLRAHVLCGSVRDSHLCLYWFDRVGIVQSKLVNFVKNLDCLVAELDSSRLCGVK